MSFQYFFFDTYIGYFLQMVPLAVTAGLAVGWWKHRHGAGKGQSLFSGLLAAYLTGLVGVTLLLRLINLAWYWLIYHQPGGRVWFFEWTYDFIPDFWNHFRGENLANALMFLPFGVLYPLARGQGFRKTLGTGLLLILTIELLQPVFGRAFDMNDVILNFVGIAAGAGLLHLIRK